MVAAIMLAGIWGIWKALVQRRYTETAGALARVGAVRADRAVLRLPARAHDRPGEPVDQHALARVPLRREPRHVDDPAAGQAPGRRPAVRRADLPAVGGAELRRAAPLRRHRPRSTTTASRARSARTTPTRDVCRDHVRRGRDGHGGYAPRFLRYAAGLGRARRRVRGAQEAASAPRATTPAVRRLPRSTRQTRPAVDIQQAGGAFQRLTLAVVIFVGALGMVALLGFLSLAVDPRPDRRARAARVRARRAGRSASSPRGGHEFFRNWLTKLATAVFIKALYSPRDRDRRRRLRRAGGRDRSRSGSCSPSGCRPIFFWAIFLYRKQITARLVAATTGAHHDGERLPRMTVVAARRRRRHAPVHRPARDAAAAAPTAAPIGRRARSPAAPPRQPPGHVSGGPTRNDHSNEGHAADAPHVSSTGHARATGNGRADHAPACRGTARRTATAQRSHRPRTAPRATGEPRERPPHRRRSRQQRARSRAGQPRGCRARPAAGRAGAGADVRASSHEDVMRRARELRQRQQHDADEQEPRT